MFSMSLHYSTYRFIVILVSLTVFNMVLLSYTWSRGDPKYACSVDSVIEGVAKYIQQNGGDSLVDHLPDTCLQQGSKRFNQDILDLAIKGIIDVCHNTVKVKSAENFSSPILTLFTTWPSTNDSEKHVVHNLTLVNWLSFKPKIEVVVFTNDTKDAIHVKSLGAKVYPIVHHAGGGAPVLRTMFETVIKLHKYSHLYGYANSDILFTDNLITTLELILTHRKQLNKKPVLLVGKRVNVEKIKFEEIQQHSAIEQISKSRGVLFGPNAEDYFITNGAFPWKDIVDVVVGRVAYDNYLVGHVICNMKYDVIDLSGSVLAVHQTTTIGNGEGWKHPLTQYNNALFKKKGIVPNFDTGFVICAPEMTFENFCGKIQLVRRTSFWDKCSCVIKKKPK